MPDKKKLLNFILENLENNPKCIDLEIISDLYEYEDLHEIASLLEHEPQRGGILGISDKKHRDYKKKIKQLVEQKILETK